MSFKCHIQDLYSDLLATGVNSATLLLTIRLLRDSRSQPRRRSNQGHLGLMPNH